MRIRQLEASPLSQRRGERQQHQANRRIQTCTSIPLRTLRGLMKLCLREPRRHDQRGPRRLGEIHGGDDRTGRQHKGPLARGDPGRHGPRASYGATRRPVASGCRDGRATPVPGRAWRGVSRPVTRGGVRTVRGLFRDSRGACRLAGQLQPRATGLHPEQGPARIRTARHAACLCRAT